MCDSKLCPHVYRYGSRDVHFWIMDNLSISRDNIFEKKEEPELPNFDYEEEKKYQQGR